MKLTNKQYGIRETEELYRVNIGVMQQKMLNFFSGYTCGIFMEKEIRRRNVMRVNQAITHSDFVK